MKDFYTAKVVEIINQIQYATLATVSVDGEPFNAPVFTAYDDELTFYWSSNVKAQHSKNIDHTGKVYIAIYDSTVAQGTGWGVYMQAEAGEVKFIEEADIALELLGNRRGKRFDRKARDMIEGDHRIYKAIPKAIWINDAEQDINGEFVKDYRVDVDPNSIIQKLSAA